MGKDNNNLRNTGIGLTIGGIATGTASAGAYRHLSNKYTNLFDRAQRVGDISDNHFNKMLDKYYEPQMDALVYDGRYKVTMSKKVNKALNRISKLGTTAKIVGITGAGAALTGGSLLIAHAVKNRKHKKNSANMNE